ncbi:hypothetical protein EV421DRAFT_2024067 [Armillaria borealis]|uniref:Uncharacterized protein n=1 Tax=Armillaria borealis TaxID=47425 RepID=A0AA39IYT7_9AGAR|nr:hypothetical protein EV421DRAFT_2024067 [Armillaria borealis]
MPFLMYLPRSLARPHTSAFSWLGLPSMIESHQSLLAVRLLHWAQNRRGPRPQDHLKLAIQASPLSLLFYLASPSPVLVVADVVSYSLWLRVSSSTWSERDGFGLMTTTTTSSLSTVDASYETAYFPLFVGSIRRSCGGSFLIETLWRSLVDGQKGSDRFETDLQTYLLRTPALVTRRGFGEGKEVIGNGLANACTEAVSSSRIVGNDRSSLFSPNAGIDDDFLPPYFTSGFTVDDQDGHLVLDPPGLLLAQYQSPNARACRIMEVSREDTFEVCWILPVSVNPDEPSRTKREETTLPYYFDHAEESLGPCTTPTSPKFRKSTWRRM